MKKILFILLLVSSAAAAQQNFDFSDSAVVTRLKKDLFFLASDSMKGREAGTADEIKARDYIINEFQKAGLTPYIKNDSDYIQKFHFENNYWDEEQNTLSIDGKEFALWSDFYPLANVGEGKVSGMATIIYFGRNDSLFNNPSIKDKVVFLYSASSNSSKIPLEDAVRNIVNNGAKAVVIVPSSDFYSLYALKISCAVPVMVFEKLSFDKINFSANSGVKLQLTQQSGYDIYNVIGCINNNAASTIIIGAHYDHLGIKNDRTSGEIKIYNGADDNASGTVAVLELARYLKQDGAKNYNYILCAFSGEEKGLLGSEGFVNSVFFSSYKKSEIKFMLDFDMVGRLGAFGNVLYVNGTGSSGQWKKIIRKNHAGDFGIKKIPDGMDGSDDYPFYKKGVPVLFFITGLHKEYHTPADDPEKINYTGEAQIIAYAKKIINAVPPDAKLKYRKVNFLQTLRSYIIYAKMFL